MGKTKYQLAPQACNEHFHECMQWELIRGIMSSQLLTGTRYTGIACDLSVIESWRICRYPFKCKVMSTVKWSMENDLEFMLSFILEILGFRTRRFKRAFIIEVPLSIRRIVSPCITRLYLMTVDSWNLVIIHSCCYIMIINTTDKKC